MLDLGERESRRSGRHKHTQRDTSIQKSQSGIRGARDVTECLGRKDDTCERNAHRVETIIKCKYTQLTEEMKGVFCFHSVGKDKHREVIKIWSEKTKVPPLSCCCT